MHFRIGAMAVTWLTTIVLQLQDEGRLSLDDKLSRWYPDLPNADQITLRMLANSTSGYYDFIQGNQSFIDQIFANPFRVWHPRELLNTTLSRGIACAPGTCFVYSHTNYILLSRIVQKVTGRSTASQMQRRILGSARSRRLADHPEGDDPATDPARVHLRSRVLRGLDDLEPVMDPRQRHDRHIDDR